MINWNNTNFEGFESGNNCVAQNRFLRHWINYNNINHNVLQWTFSLLAAQFSRLSPNKGIKQLMPDTLKPWLMQWFLQSTLLLLLLVMQMKKRWSRRLTIFSLTRMWKIMNKQLPINNWVGYSTMIQFTVDTVSVMMSIPSTVFSRMAKMWRLKSKLIFVLIRLLR